MHVMLHLSVYCYIESCFVDTMPLTPPLLLRRYGVRAPVYLRDKNGLVAQPDPYSPDKVIFDSGKFIDNVC